MFSLRVRLSPSKSKCNEGGQEGQGHWRGEEGGRREGAGRRREGRGRIGFKSLTSLVKEPSSSLQTIQFLYPSPLFISR
jgi:hypothetical protein